MSVCVGRVALLCASAALSASCGEETPTVEPSTATSFGHVRVRLVAPDVELSGVEGLVVHFGGIRAVDIVAATGGGVLVTVQGSPAAGPVDISLQWEGGELLWPAAFTYLPPKDDQLQRWMAIGASWTQGIQGNGLSIESQQTGPAAQVARAAGAYLGLPLLREDLLPPATPDDIHADCSVEQPELEAARLVTLLKNPESGEIELARARLDTELPVRNVAVGGYRLVDILRGGDGKEVILENIISNPAARGVEIFSRPPRSQIDIVEEVRPDIVICTDLYANDVSKAVFADGDAVFADGDIDVERATPLEPFREAANEFAQRVSAAAKHVFFSNLPRVNYLPHVSDLRASRIAAGEEPQVFDEKLARINEHIASLNAALAEAIAPFPHLHVVDLASRVEEMLRDGVQIGGQRYVIAKFGGMFSMDHVHLSHTGYALVADLFLETINRALGVTLPSLDLAAIAAQDPESPAALREHPAARRCLPEP